MTCEQKFHKCINNVDTQFAPCSEAARRCDSIYFLHKDMKCLNPDREHKNICKYLDNEKLLCDSTIKTCTAAKDAATESCDQKNAPAFHARALVNKPKQTVQRNVQQIEKSLHSNIIEAAII